MIARELSFSRIEDSKSRFISDVETKFFLTLVHFSFPTVLERVQGRQEVLYIE